MAQIATNTAQAVNLVRSAIAPEINAGVIIANISWKAANARSGTGYTPPLFVNSSTALPSPDNENSPYHCEFASYPNANLNP